MTLILTNDKPTARISAARNRLTVHEQMKETAPLLLASQSFPAAPGVEFHILSGFYPIRSELDPRPLMIRLAGEGWTTSLPVVQTAGQALRFRRWLPGEPLEKGTMNTENPMPSATEVEPDVLLVPLLAFDAHGYRLGYGGGFYDRTLATLRKQKNIIAIGLAYAGQQAENVPHDAHDQRLDYIMTEHSVMKCG